MYSEPVSLREGLSGMEILSFYYTSPYFFSKVKNFMSIILVPKGVCKSHLTHTVLFHCCSDRRGQDESSEYPRKPGQPSVLKRFSSLTCHLLQPRPPPDLRTEGDLSGEGSFYGHTMGCDKEPADGLSLVLGTFQTSERHTVWVSPSQAGKRKNEQTGLRMDTEEN